MPVVFCFIRTTRKRPHERSLTSPKNIAKNISKKPIRLKKTAIILAFSPSCTNFAEKRKLPSALLFLSTLILYT